ncbi:hypothetical protein ACFLZC_02205 [Patescibacteria group bacterium]
MAEPTKAELQERITEWEELNQKHKNYIRTLEVGNGDLKKELKGAEVEIGNAKYQEKQLREELAKKTHESTKKEQEKDILKARLEESRMLLNRLIDGLID